MWGQEISIDRLECALKAKVRPYWHYNVRIINKETHLLILLPGNNWNEKNIFYQNLRDKLVRRKPLTHYDYSFLPKDPPIIDNAICCELPSEKAGKNIVDGIQHKINKNASLKNQIKAKFRKNQILLTLLTPSSTVEHRAIYRKLRSVMLNKHGMNRDLLLSKITSELDSSKVKTIPADLNTNVITHKELAPHPRVFI